MKPNPFPLPSRTGAVWLSLLALSSNIGGCATFVATTPADDAAPTIGAASIPPNAEPASALVTRSGRYTLIELGPDDEQRALMQQVVQTTVPPTMDATVGEALRHLLSRTGYQLCDDAWALDLYTLPLPAAHLHLGPMTLRQALLTLIGPAWDLQVNEKRRLVCMTPHDQPQAITPTQLPAPAPATPTASSPTNPISNVER